MIPEVQEVPAKKIQLNLDGTHRARLTFLCDMYQQPAASVIHDLIDGAFEGLQDALRARQEKLDATSAT